MSDPIQIAPPSPPLRALDLCAGAGGLSLGAQRAGFDVLGVELDADAIDTHRRHVGIAAWRVLTSPRDPWREPAICSAIGAWIGLSVGLAAAYPLTGGEVAAALLCVEGAAVSLGWLAYARGRRARIGGRRRATVIEVAVLALVAVETAVVLIGPWARNPFADWHLARASYLVGFVFVALLHVQRVRARLGL